VQVEPNENMIPNKIPRMAAQVASPLSKRAELGFILAGIVQPQVECFAQYTVFTLF